MALVPYSGEAIPLIKRMDSMFWTGMSARLIWPS